jgi:hypothetical protein
MGGCDHMLTVVYALDIGVYHTNHNGEVLPGTTAAWCRLTSGVENLDSIRWKGDHNQEGLHDPNGWECQCGRSIQDLGQGIAQDLQNGHRVALGFEAPMWLPVVHNGNDAFSARFAQERNRYQWYKQAGAAATVKGIVLGVMLRAVIEEERHEPVSGVTALDNWQVGNMLLLEAFVTRTYRLPRPNLVPPGRCHEWDALTAALAWGGIHANFALPVGAQPQLLHPQNLHRPDCISIWDMIWGTQEAIAGPPDCDVVALQFPIDQG